MKKKFKFTVEVNAINGNSVNEIEIKKDKIIKLKYRDVTERECSLSDNRTFSIKRLSGCFMIKCKLDFKCIQNGSGKIEDASAEIKFNIFEYLKIKHYKKELWINDKSFQIKIVIALFSAVIGAVSSYIICKICS